jgi:RHS repeat-associated protein
MFAEDQLERLRTFPDIGRDDLIRYFTLTPADVAFLDESNLYYLRARYYDSTTGQFLSVDPMVDSTLSPYAYVAGNPLNGSDPTGLSPRLLRQWTDTMGFRNVGPWCYNDFWVTMSVTVSTNGSRVTNVSQHHAPSPYYEVASLPRM